MSHRFPTLIALVIAALGLAACTATTSPTTGPDGPGTSAPVSASAAASALVRAGAQEPVPVASAPIEVGQLAGGTFHVFSVRSTESATRLEYVVTHPTLTLSGYPEQVYGPNRRDNLPVLSVGGVDYEVAEHSVLTGTWGRPVAGLISTVVPDPHSTFAVYAPLPAGVSEVEVSTPLIASPLRVTVDRGTAAVPAGSADVPILGRAVFGDKNDRAHDQSLILTVHGVRRVENATVVYYSAVFPEGVAPVRFSSWGGEGGSLSNASSYLGFLTSTVEVIDWPSMRGLQVLGGGGPHLKESCDRFAFTQGENPNALVCWGVLPPLEASTTSVDVIVANQLIQDVPVSEGLMTPTSDQQIPELGTGWPVIPAESLAEATPDNIASNTVDLRFVMKEGAITTSGDQLDLDATVLFDYNQATLTANAQQVLATAAEKVKATGRVGVVTVTGHTDSDGSDAANQDLSSRRAQAVADALGPLLGAGYSFAVEGKGEREPVASNDTDAGKAANRRVTILPPA